MKKTTRLTPASLGYEILKYLVRHPKAQDSMEGIVEWWLLEQRIVDTSAAVQVALVELTAFKFLLKRQALDGRITYRLNSRKAGRIKQLLQEEFQVRASKKRHDS